MKANNDEDEQLTECTAPSSSALQYQRYKNPDTKPHQAGSSRVADYFAVLGTGSILTRKQKSSRGNDGSLLRSDADSHQEEEYARLQRWYREIVHVQLVGSDPLLEEVLNRRNSKATPYTTAGQQRHEASLHNNKNATAMQRARKSLRNTVLGSEGNASENIDLQLPFRSTPTTNEISQAEQDGYEILRFTRGNINHPIQYNNTAFSLDDSILNTSNQLDTTINTSFNYSMYTSASNSVTLNPEEMVWEANIHPRCGIRREVLLYKTGCANNPHVQQSKSARQIFSKVPGSVDSSAYDDPVTAFQKMGGVAARVVGRATQLPRKQAASSDPFTSCESSNTPSFYVAYRRRLPDETDIPALADIRIMYIQLPFSCISNEQYHQHAALPALACNTSNEHPVTTPCSSTVSGVMDRRSLSKLLWNRSTSTRPVVTMENEQVKVHEEEKDDKVLRRSETTTVDKLARLVPLRNVLRVPKEFDEVILPSCLETLEIPKNLLYGQSVPKIVEMPPIEVVMMESSSNSETATTSSFDEHNMYIPVLVTRRIRTGEEERWREDPGITDLSMSYLDVNGKISLDLTRITEADDEDDEFNETDESLLGQTKWKSFAEIVTNQTSSMPLGVPVLIYRRNIPFGFCDASFAACVLDRFPEKDYKHLPFLQEELPLFCHPTGIRLARRKYRDLETPECFSFIVKNERGDEINISALSFEEPISDAKLVQLRSWSYRRRRTCLAHRRFWECNDFTGLLDESVSMCNDQILTGFEEWMTLERKTICIISRFHYTTAFRQFLTHLHTLSTSYSEIPIERYISHLLLSVPVPKPGGQSVLLPLSTCAMPVLFSMTPAKDFPLLDLSYHTLFSCLDVPNVVTVVLGFLVLERGKVILVSKFSSVVTDSCELLRSLLFPFEICAPYVPRLTEPFRSCLDFPGAIFAGIYDDSDANCLAVQVQQNLPEETLLVHLDTGEIRCNGDRVSVLGSAWNLLPPELRNSLVEDVETLCLDANMISGQEALPPEDIYSDKIGGTGLDDRAVRDAFFRFFCCVLSGYENYLRFPDANYLISGEEWFDTQRFVAAASPSLQGFLGSLVTTQLFQSFVQRRTESSDFRCMLLDECLAVFQKDGGKRFGRKASTQGELPILLVDQCTSESSYILGSDSGVTSTLSAGATDVQEIASSYRSFDMSHNIDKDNFMTNCEGDIVMFPFVEDLPSARFAYFAGGYGCFPENFDVLLFSPSNPDSYEALDGLDATKVPILTRSGKELEDAVRGWNTASTRGYSKRPRKCMWQLPKLTASHFFGVYALCIPTQVAQPHLSISQQSCYLTRVFGVLRCLRHRQRIVADEAAYRSLIVACGRVATDRRAEIVNLFGLMRQQGIVPSSVTLGQYTSAIAEGFRKRNIVSNALIDDILEVEVALNKLDEFLSFVESVGKNFARRSRTTAEGEKVPHDFVHVENEIISEGTMGTQSSKQDGVAAAETYKRSRNWKPVCTSSSFVPFSSALQSTSCDSTRYMHEHLCKSDFKFVAMWSRTSPCAGCGYSALDEEIQASWDNGPHDYIGSIPCPRCNGPTTPMLGYRILSLEEALGAYNAPRGGNSTHGRMDNNVDEPCDHDLPPQLRKQSSRNHSSAERYNDEASEGFVPYLNPFVLRSLLERGIEEKGEDALDRDTLRNFDPRVFWNFWWYCSRFSFPLPLAINPVNKDDSANKSNSKWRHNKPLHFCAFSSWDKSIALRGCASGARAVNSFLESSAKLYNFSQFIKNPEYSLLHSFSLQSHAKSDWEHPDLSQILVELVSASNHETRDLTFALELLIGCIRKHRQRQASVDGTVDIGDCYITLLYLVRYQCTSAFHVFFPTKAKPCKGYHFWCAKGTPLPPFDRMYREAAARLKNEADRALCSSQEASDLSLGFRSIYGHII